MAKIDVNMKPVQSTKSHFLRNVLNVQNQHGKDFQNNIREGLVLTDRGHAIWFTIPRGGLNHFFKQDGAWFVEETLSENRTSWGDRDHAEGNFNTGTPAVRSLILRGENNTNRYYGEFQLVKLEARKRTWLRIATEVNIE